MINLLPPDVKQSVAYARRNSVLLRWIAALLVSAVGIAIVAVFGLLYINKSIDDNQKQVAQMQEQLKVQKLEETQKRVEDISTSLKLVTQVLSKQVLFSQFIPQVGAAMPPNTILTNLSVTKLQGGIDLQAAATDYAAATQVQVNLKDPANKIFSNADIVNIQCVTPSAENSSGSTGGNAAGSSVSSKYPCTVSIRAQFAANNPFLFINLGAKK
jgi:Tfp pilus assembly protein PilN